MALIEFLKDAGARLFNDDDDAAEAIRRDVEQRLPGQVRDLRVEFEDGQVKLSGEADSQAARTKAILAAGNVKGVMGVDASGVRIPAEPPPSPGGAVAGVRPAASPAAGGAKEQIYEIRKGDTLSAIAQTHYGKASEWHRLFEANREIIDDPDRIYPGQKIVIPG